MDMLTPSQRGAVAESAITTAALELGLTVLRPLCEGRRYDLVVDLEPRLLRVQCKLARNVNGVLAIRLQTCRYTTNGYVRQSYTAAEIDAGPLRLRMVEADAADHLSRRLHSSIFATCNDFPDIDKFA